eukprot:TRINITY_DN21209_c0_g1_i3.p1 TRINITY_DN21209_c0_g1~~TRINITY_DN21209_c0_g1_i3.p1  ORF type:complete len:288 (+),score=93.92 TRINITY_DN21209_c0_g1_i3:61-864(+)
MAAQGTKRAYDAGDVSVLENPKVAIVSAAKRRYTKWERMQTLMLRAVSGLADGEAAARSATSLGLNEHCYVLAKTPHPTREGTTVCLVEKPQGAGFALVPEDALNDEIKAAVRVLQPDQQYSDWTQMEEQLGVKCTRDFKAKKGQVGFMLAQAQHPKHADAQVVAVLFPNGDTTAVAMLKLSALQVLPDQVARVIDPDGRLQEWPAMAEKLGVEERRGTKVAKGSLGEVENELPHLKRPHITVVALRMLDGTGSCMITKDCIHLTKF